MEGKISTQTAQNDEEFKDKSVAFLKEKIIAAIASKGKAVIGLSGGETPGPIYEKLFKETDIDWTVFLVDERHIEPTNKDSNTGLVSKAFNPSVKYHFVHPDTSLPLDKCITAYDGEVKKITADGPVDVLTLGLGPDGHIASLFPPLSEEHQKVDTAHLVTHTTTTRFAVFDRITLTYPVILAAKSKVFFMKASKKPVWDQMLAASNDPARHTNWPAIRVIESGNTTVITTV